ncbi:MAG: beta strand repeat-containing protein [Vulcanimicrobiota bacterium]
MYTRNALLVVVILSICLLCFSGCGGGSSGGGGAQGGSSSIQSGTAGTILITAPFPKSGLGAIAENVKSLLTRGSFRYIPPTVQLYIISVCEQGTTNAVVAPLSISRPTTGEDGTLEITGVPLGWKTVHVSAYDAQKILLAKGSSDVDVILGTSNDVSITLNAVNASPAVSTTTPASNANGVALNSSVSVTFDQPMDSLSFTTETFYLTGPSGTVAGKVSAQDATAILTPYIKLSAKTLYTATVDSSVKNTTGLAMGTTYSWSFTTGEEPDTTPPKVTSTSPLNGTVDIELNAVVSAIFSKSMDSTSINSTTFTVSDGKGAVSGTITTEGNSTVFLPDSPFAYSTLYTATLSGSVKDLAGNSMVNDYSWSFTTKAQGSTDPVLTAVSPESGEVGTAVTLTGTNLGTSGTISFGSTSATATSWSATTIVTTVPTGLASGTYNITVIPDGSTVAATISFTVTSLTDPVLTAVSPATGSPGTTVTLTGANLGTTPGTITFGTTAAAATSWSATTIVTKVPGGLNDGATTITVTPHGSMVSPTISFTVTGATEPYITDVSPSSGTPGTSVTLTGANLGTTAGTVTFGDTAAVITSWSDNAIVTTVPTSVAGTVTISVTPAGSTKTVTISFTVTEPPDPVIKTVTPGSGSPGTTVALAGANFGTTAGTVTFGTTAATVVSWSDTSITTRVPTGLAAGTYNIIVTTVGGQSASIGFTVSGSPGPTGPSLSAVVPNPASPGTSVTLTGANLGNTQGTGTVTFGNHAATVVSWTSTCIVTTVPTGLAAGTYTITVTTDGGQSATISFTVPGATDPAITAVTPSSGAPGTLVTLTGTNLGTSGTISFGNTAATFVSWSATCIVTTVPTGLADGTYTITVTTSGGKTATISFTVGTYWTVEKRQPTYNTINDSWATGSNAYFVCDGGVILHHDGSHLTTMTSGTTNNLHDVWGASSNNIYAVGAGGTILHYNGASWSGMTNPDTGNHDLWGVGGGAANNIFAVGTSGTILHYDGSTWSDISGDNPDSPSPKHDLLDVLVEPGSNFVYAAGTDRTVIQRDASLAWSKIDGGGPTLTSIWAINNNNVYVAGYSGTVNKWDQSVTSWTTGLGPGGFDIQGIWGTAANSFYVVGDSDNIRYYNGTTWNTMDSQTAGIDFRSVFGAAANNIFATGTGGVIRYFDNTTDSTTGPWTSIPPQLFRVWGSSASDIFATGEHGAIIHSNGSTWSDMFSGTTEWLRGLWGIDSSNVYAVGSNWQTSGSKAVMLQYGGAAWNDITSSNPLNNSWYNAIWGSSTSDLYAAGDSGQIIHYNGISWSDETGNNPDPAGTKRNINGIWGYGSKVYFIGNTDGSTNKGLIILNNGVLPWTIMPNPDTGYHHLNGIWGFSDSDIFAVGDGGVILRFNGTSWSVMSQSLTTNNLFGVWGTSGSNVYAVGDNGTILHWDGSSWSYQTVSGVFHTLRSVWGSSSTDIYAVGSEGIILHYK